LSLKRTPSRVQRLQIAKTWIPTYIGENIVRGYKKHFALSPLCAVVDLQLMGYEFTPEYIEQLKRAEVSRSNSKNKLNKETFENFEEDEFEDYDGSFNDDEIENVQTHKTIKFKNHELVGGKLLQTNKKFSQLKEKQKSLIAEWFYIECDSFYKNSNKFPSSKIEKEDIVNLVYERIEKRDIWIPFCEVKMYFCKKKNKIENRVLKMLEKV